MFEDDARTGDSEWELGPFDVLVADPFEHIVAEIDWPGFFDPVQEASNRLIRIERQIRRLEAIRAEALVAAYDLAVQDAADRLGTSTSRSGPVARSFLKQTAAELKMTEGAVGHLLDTTVEAMENMPRTWAVFAEGRAPWRAVDVAVRENVGVPVELMCEYDDLAATAAEKAHAARLKDRLRRARERLMIDTAVARRRLAEADRRVECEALADGQAGLLMRGPGPEWIAVDHALTASAVQAKGVEGETRSIGQLRHDIALDILTEGLKAGALPDPGTKVSGRNGVAVELYLTVPALTLLGEATAPATIEGYGPIDIETARRLAADAPSFYRVFTDPVTGVRLDMDRAARRPPADLIRWLRVRDHECRDPGCRRPAHRTDLDHVAEWQHGGRTEATNLVSICRSMHRLKSMGLWQERLEADGSVTWTSPWGRRMTDPPPEPGDPAPKHLLPPESDDCPF